MFSRFYGRPALCAPMQAFPSRLSLFFLVSFLALSAFHAGRALAAPPLTRQAGNYAVTLRLPAEGLFAGEETDIEFHVADTSQDDPVQGAAPIVNARVVAAVTMPVMPGMPAQAPKTHREGVPGDYGVVAYFPHGGDYQVALTITPPAPDAKAFTVAFPVVVGDTPSVRGRKPKPPPYSLEVTAGPSLPRAGDPTDLTLVIRSRDTKQPVTEFDVTHTKQIHFMVVSADLTRFAHEHPEAGANGRFTLRYTFPTGGEYHLFADVAPKEAGSQILMQPIVVSGPPSNAPRPAVSLTDTVDGIRAALQSDPAKLPVGRAINLTFILRDAAANAPITDIEPYLGAMGHLMLIQQDGVTFVHSHPDETDPTNGHQGAITFLARFPKPGRYHGWLQFQRKGQVETAAFTWDVKGRTP